MQLDHIMYAVKNLASGNEELEKLSGVKPAYGGAHANSGTCNALLSFGASQYLEIIAPDENQTLVGTMGEALINMSMSKIRTWAVTMTDQDSTTKIIEALEYSYKIIDMSRTRTDGVKLEWKILFVTDHPFGNLMPFFIDWLESPHPANNTPKGCSLKKFTVQLEENHLEFTSLMHKFSIPVDVVQGETSLIATIDSPNGIFKLT